MSESVKDRLKEALFYIERLEGLLPTEQEVAHIFRLPDDAGENCLDDMELSLCAGSEPMHSTDVIYDHFREPEMEDLRRWMLRVRKVVLPVLGLED